jgi:thioesterase domain-containing protein
LGGGRPFYGLQSLGLEEHGNHHATVEEMAAHYLEEVIQFQPQGPYFLGGYCMGGLVAYEMAQRLIQKGQEVKMLVLMETFNPSVVQENNTFGLSTRIWMQKIAFHWDNLRRISTKEKVMYFKKRFGETVSRRSKRLLFRCSALWAKLYTNGHQKMPPTLLEDINDFAALVYRPQRYVGRIHLFRPERGYSIYEDPEMGWKDLAEGGIDVITIPVNTGGMFVEPYVALVAEKLRDAFDQCLDSTVESA